MQISKLGIVVPCFNENNTVIHFLKKLAAAFKPDYETVLIVVNDGSTDDTLALLVEYQKLHPELTILDLHYNVGHQRAIYQGIHYAFNQSCSHFIVMDGDGEDNPSAIHELVKHTQVDLVQVGRGKRNENLMFKISYWAYLLLFKFITGKTLKFGNFCFFNRKVANCILDNSFIHLAAFLSKQRFVTYSIISDRDKRINGKSKMNFSSLLQHAFNAFVEYADKVLLLFLKLALLLGIFFSSSIAYVVYQKFFTSKAVLGWASTLSIGFLNAALLCLGFFVIGLILIFIAQKNNKSVPPIYNVL